MGCTTEQGNSPSPTSLPPAPKILIILIFAKLDLPSPSRQHLHLVASNRGATEARDLRLSWEVFTLSLATAVSSTCGHKAVAAQHSPPSLHRPSFLYFTFLAC